MRRDESTRWRELCETGIDVSRDRTDWHSGRAHDVLRISGGPVIAATVGGVWIIDPNSGDASPVSDAWPALSVNALCQSPIHPRHVFACAAAPIALYETDLTANDPLLQWRAIGLPTNVNNVHSVAATQAPPFRVVIATNSGVFWSDLGASAYAWKQAFVNNVGQQFDTEATAAAVGKACVIVGPRGTTSQIYRGTWDTSGRLIFKLISFPPHNQSNLARKLDRLSIASCGTAPQNSYVLAFDTDGTIVGVLASSDDAITWSWCSFVTVDGQTLKDYGGNETAGGNVKHVAVSMYDPASVTLPGLKALISTDAGTQWYPINAPHNDIHRVYFDPNDPNGDTLLCASDGGVFERMSGKVWDGKLNRNVRTLQCYTPSLVREFWGCMDVSEVGAAAPLVATGLQDNGNVMLSLAPGTVPRWTRFMGNDGGFCRFLSTGAIIYSGVGAKGLNAKVASGPNWDGKDIPDAAFDQPALRAGIPGPRLYTFRKPWTDSFMDSSLLGLAADDAEPGVVFGLFGKFSGQVTNWAQLCKLDLQTGDSITAFAENSRVIWAATAQGRLFPISWNSYPLDRTRPVINGFYRPAEPTIYELQYALGGPTNPITQGLPELSYVALSVEPPGGDLWVLAARKDPNKQKDPDAYQSRIFRVVSTAWEEMTLNLADSSGFGPRLQAIYADNRNVYAAGDGAIYRLESEREWVDISGGLPIGFQGSDLAELKIDGTPVLLLSTFDRGVWRSDLGG